MSDGRLELFTNSDCAGDNPRFDIKAFALFARVQHEPGKVATYYVSNVYALEEWEACDLVHDEEDPLVSIGTFRNLTEARTRVEELSNASAIDSNDLVEDNLGVIYAARKAIIGVMKEEVANAKLDDSTAETIIKAVEERTDVYKRDNTFAYQIGNTHTTQTLETLIEIFSNGTQDNMQEEMSELIELYKICESAPYNIMQESGDHVPRIYYSQVDISYSMKMLLAKCNGHAKDIDAQILQEAQNIAAQH